tara:strand:+ start:5431 stop:5604 length:174 start_codon:yes stop_codon:yes gene_type:complete
MSCLGYHLFPKAFYVIQIHFFVGQSLGVKSSECTSAVWAHSLCEDEEVFLYISDDVM